MLRWRLVSAAVILTGFFGLLYLDYHHPLGTSGAWLLPLALLVSVLMVSELLDMWSQRSDRPVAWPLYLGAPLTVLAASLPVFRQISTGATSPSGFGDLAWPLAAVSAVVMLAFLVEMTRYDQPGRATGAVGLATLAVVYAGLLPSFLVSLRLWGGHAWGMAALLTMIAVVKLSDTGAYFVGRALGRHKMSPRLSPGKTVEGAVGALLAGILAALLCYYVLVPAVVGMDVPRGPIWGWLLFGLLGALFGMIGDLAESLLKRDAGRKDSSSWLPGLGGVLDVLDSLVFVAPVTYFYFAAGVIGPS